jgi:fatty-acyl-CoA synthase
VTGHGEIRTLADWRAASAGGLPADLPESTYAVLARTALAAPDDTALTFFANAAALDQCETWSYGDLFRGVTRTANLFHTLGLAADEVVAVVLPNLPQTHLVLWGGEAAGIVMPINPMLDADTIAALLTTARARMLVTLAPDLSEDLSEDLYRKAVTICGKVASLRSLVLVGAPVTGLGAGVDMPLSVEVRGLEESAALPDDRLLSGRRIAASDPASYFCTGGTTGLPKIAIRTHGQEVANAWMTVRTLGKLAAPGATFLCGLPLFHVNAVMVTGLVVFLSGGHVVLATPEGFRSPGLIDRFWEVVAHYSVEMFSAVPTLLNMLLDRPAAAPTSLRCVFSGAAPLSTELLERFERTCKVAVVEGYGLTETACVASLNPVEGEHRAGSVGLPLAWEQIAIVVLDGEGRFVREAAVDEPGVVAIAGPNVFTGYLLPDHNRDLWIERGDGRRWLNTGDLGRTDADGYLWLTGRAKDLIIRGGHNIDPVVIEDAYHALPEVAMAAAVGRPDVHAGEVPVVYVQLRAGMTATSQDLADRAAAHIGERAALPKRVTVLDQLPLTAIGKIHKPTLRLREAIEVAQTALCDASVPFEAVEGSIDGRFGLTVQVRTDPQHHDGVLSVLGPFAFRAEVLQPEPCSD